MEIKIISKASELLASGKRLASVVLRIKDRELHAVYQNDGTYYPSNYLKLCESCHGTHALLEFAANLDNNLRTNEGSDILESLEGCDDSDLIESIDDLSYLRDFLEQIERDLNAIFQSPAIVTIVENER